MPCLVVGGENRTVAARVEQVTGQAVVEPEPSLVCGGISNLLVSRGQQGPVLAVTVRGRTGPQASLTQAIRAGLARVPGLDPAHQLGMGGVFRMETGTAKAHINPG